jgi:cell wall-associated NlpC family hydrolase
MNKFINISLLLGFIIFTGCLERPRQHTTTTYSIQPILSSNIIVTQAYKHLGKPYKYGATGPNSFDCSGFVYAVHRDLKIKIPRTSRDQSAIEGKKLSRNELMVGDLVFFDTSLKGEVNHSGIYLGEGKFIHASSGKAFSVTISDINAWYKDKFRWGKRINENK